MGKESSGNDECLTILPLSLSQERLLSTLQPEEIDKILQSFGWTPLDLARGYMIQVSKTEDEKERERAENMLLAHSLPSSSFTRPAQSSFLFWRRDKSLFGLSNPFVVILPLHLHPNQNQPQPSKLTITIQYPTSHSLTRR